MSEQIYDFIKQHKFLAKIDCISSPDNYTPAQRILEISTSLSNEFLIVYCDNYIPSDETIFQQISSKSKLRLLLEKRLIGNFSITNQGKAEFESAIRTNKSPYVELGYIAVRDKIFLDELNRIHDLEFTLYEYSKTFPIDFTLCNNTYISLSNFRKYIDQKLYRKIMLIDRDGVINEKMRPRNYVTQTKDLKYISNNLSFLQKLSKKGFDFIVATNQPGIATGALSEASLIKIHKKITADLRIMGINILAFYVCKHHWDDKCNCRKPQPGLITKILTEFSLNPSNIFFIGDQQSDMQAAASANISGIDVNNASMLSNLLT
jgi:D-glycero-D-manno-heptose 1,7-bisphosphate phosphatase